MVVALLILLSTAALYILFLAVRYSRRQDRSHNKFNILAALVEASYAGQHAEEEPGTGEARSRTSRRDS